MSFMKTVTPPHICGFVYTCFLFVQNENFFSLKKGKTVYLCGHANANRWHQALVEDAIDLFPPGRQAQ